MGHVLAPPSGIIILRGLGCIIILYYILIY
jgi:hypothetical protein